MNRLERFMWGLRGEAARMAAEQYDSPGDAISLPILGWLFTAIVAYAAVQTFTTATTVSVWTVAGAVTVAVVLLLFARLSIGATLASKYYFTEWTADVDPPEVFD